MSVDSRSFQSWGRGKWNGSDRSWQIGVGLSPSLTVSHYITDQYEIGQKINNFTVDRALNVDEWSLDTDLNFMRMQVGELSTLPDII